MAARVKVTVSYWNCDREVLWFPDRRKAERFAARTRKLRTVVGVRVA